MLDWLILSKNIDIEEVKSNPHLPWSREGLSWNPMLTVDVMNMSLPNATGQWVHHQAKRNPAHVHIIVKGKRYIATTDLRLQYGYYDIEDLSMNVSMDLVKKYPHIPWRRDMLSMNKNITVEVMDMNLHRARKRYNRYELSKAVNIEQVKMHPDRRWDRNGLSLNPTITMDVIHMELPNATRRWNMKDVESVISIEEVRNGNVKLCKDTIISKRGVILDDVNYL